ncbi:MAG: hypothetical protein ABSE39_06790 [Candidatus Bathyarchaeia archaeon]
MTTVMVVKCRDGVILCSEGQQSSLETKEMVSKIHPVNYRGKTDRFCLLGCAGSGYFIPRFKEHVGKAILSRGKRTYGEALDGAIESYSGFVKTRNKKIGFGTQHDFPSAIFVGYESTDAETHVYSLEPPLLPKELSAPYSAAIGSGGVYASLLLSIAETALDRIGLVWTDLSTELVAQVSYMILGRIVNYDMYSGMNAYTWKVNENGYTTLDDEQVFHRHELGEKYRLTVLLKTCSDEIPRFQANLRKFAKDYNINIKELIAKTIADLGPLEK